MSGEIVNPANVIDQRDAAPPAVASRLYYGWAMVALAAAAMVATLPGRTHGLGMVTERLLADSSLGLTRTAYGQLNLWATLIGALFCIGCGRLIDRFGCRLVLTTVLLSLAATVLAMTRAAGVLALFAAIALTRGFGQSALSVVSLTIVGKWFERRLSWAMGAYTILMALGFIAAALIGRRYADVDWRILWGGMGVCLLLFAPLAWAVTRNSPEAFGLPVDGGESVPDAPSVRDTPVTGFTLGAALRTPAFWVFGFATSVFGLIAAGVGLFNESILVERGFPKEVYYDSLAIGTAVGLASNFLAGWLASKWNIARLTSVALMLLAAALVWLTRVSTYPGVVAYVAANALAGGVITVVFFTVWGRLYGRLHLGKIQGAAQMLTVIASAIGPFLLAQAKVGLGSYAPALLMLAAVTALLGVVAWCTPLPQPRWITSRSVAPHIPDVTAGSSSSANNLRRCEAEQPSAKQQSSDTEPSTTREPS